MEEERRSPAKAIFFIIVIISLVVAGSILIRNKSISNLGNGLNPFGSKGQQSTTTSSVVPKENRTQAILGSNAITAAQSVNEFLNPDFKDKPNPFKMDIFKEAIAHYENMEYEKAYFLFEKNLLVKDPISAILMQNCKVVGTKEPFLKIAIAVPVTGDLKEMGLKELLGAALAQEEINKIGGIAGKKIFITIADDGGNIDRAQEVARLIAKDPSIVAVVGHYTSGCTLAGAAIYEKNGIVQITPSSSSPLISNAGQYIFRVCPTDIQQGQFLAKFALSKFGPNNRFYLLRNPSNAYSNGLGDAIANALRKSGASLSSIIEYEEGTMDFQSRVAPISDLETSILFYAGEDVEGSHLIETLQTTRKNTNLITGDAMFTYKIKETLGNSGYNAFISTFYHADAGYSFQKEFTDLFLKRFDGGTPNAVCALTFDAVSVLKKALEITQKFNRDGVLEGMSRVNFEGATGRIKFDENGDIPNKTLVMLQVQNNRFTPFKTW